MCNKHRTAAVLITLSIFFTCFTSCEWEQMQPIEELPENVSFINDIVPIFNQSCNSVGCHNAGGISPDLSEGNAYDVLISDDMLDLNNPENSVLYEEIINSKDPMPLSGVLPKSQTDKILVWIREGANNN